MRSCFALTSLFIFLCVFPTANAASEAPKAAAAQKAGVDKEFPYRSHYIDVEVIETADLSKRFDNVVIVDVRSKYEYETLHIKGSHNIPVNKSNFTDKIRELRQKSDKPIVFYCNGKTCRKSYKAALLALSAHIPNCNAYDAGVFDWAKANPDRTVLLGKSPIKVEDLISKEKLKERMLKPKEFEAKIDPKKTIVLDVRDRRQRDVALFPFQETRAQLDEVAKLVSITEQAKKEKKTLLVYDAVGKQVRWMQYHLEGMGLKDYYFMKGGAQGYWDDRLGKVVLGKSDDKDKK